MAVEHIHGCQTSLGDIGFGIFLVPGTASYDGDFTTAEYYIFLAMKQLQLNPEVSTICMRSFVGPEEEMSLYRYFKSVEQI